MSRPVLAGIVVVVLLVVVVSSSASAQAERERLVLLKSPCLDFVMDPETGTLFGVDPNANKVFAYRRGYFDGRKEEVAESAPIGKYPCSVVLKRYKDKSWLVVACRKDGDLYVLDPKTLKLVNRIALSKAGASDLAGARDAEDPFVYYVLGTTQARTSGQVARVRLDTMKDEGTLDIERPAQALAVSADGKHLYMTDGYGEIRGFSPDGKGGWESLHLERDIEGRCVPGPFGRTVGAGSGLYTSDLAGKVAELGAYPLGFLDHRPLIVCRDGETLRLFSYNSQKRLGEVRLSAGFTNCENWSLPGDDDDRYYEDEESFPLHVADDPGKDRMIAACGSRIYVVPLASLKLPDETFLVVKARVPDVVYVGRTTRIPLTPVDKRTRISLKSGPKGLKLTDNSLTWTPDSSAVGKSTVVLQLKQGDNEKETKLEVRVAQPGIALGFIPDNVAVSPSEKFALVWTEPSRHRDDYYRMREREGGEARRSRIALIDIDKMKVVKEKELLYEVAAAAVDDRYVYVGPSSSDRVNALDHEELTRQKHSLTRGRAARIVPVSDKLLLVMTAAGIETFSIPEIAAVKSPLAETATEDADAMRRRGRAEYYDEYGRRRVRTDALIRLRDGWCANGIVFDPRLTRTRMLISVDGLPSINVERGSRPTYPQRWDRYFNRESLMTVSGQRIAGTPSGETSFLEDHPVMVTLTVTGERKGPVRATATFRELLGGEPVREVNLFEKSMTGYDPYGEATARMMRELGVDASGDHIASAGRTVALVLGKTVYFQRLDDETLAKCKPPFQFERFDQVTSIDTTGKTAIQPKLRGGEKPFEFELTVSQKGLSVDPETGVVTVDGSLLLSEAVSALMDVGGRKAEFRLRDVGDEESAPDPAKIVDAVAKPLKERFKELTGREAKGIPVLVPIGVTAVDAKQNVTAMDFQAVIEVPDAAFRKSLETALVKAKEKLAARQREREEYEKRVREERAAREAAARKAAGNGDVEARIKALEDRVRAMEMKLDLLVEILRDRQGPEGDRPRDEKDAPAKDRREKAPRRDDAAKE